MADFVIFDIRERIDEQLLGIEAHELHRYLSRATVFDLSQSAVRPFFVSTLLHGNETSGWNATRRFITDFPDASFVLFVGNVDAAAVQMRHLADEADFNRIWRQQPWSDAINQLLERFNPWCGVDIHNNSGPNPHYSVVTDHRASTLALAALFSKKVIFTDHTLDILAHAVSFHCPALTVETGTVDDPTSEQRAYDFLKRLNQLRRVPEPSVNELETYETVGIVKVEHENGSLENFPRFDASLKQKSFSTLPAGSPFIDWLPAGWQVHVSDPAHDSDLTHDFLEFRDQSAFLKCDVVMSMFTNTPLLAIQDCVCYFLKTTSLAHG